jgi:hypothetical protein
MASTNMTANGKRLRDKRENVSLGGGEDGVLECSLTKECGTVWQR